MRTPHDLLFHFAFADPDVGRAELRRVLPRALVDALDLSTLEVEPARTIDAGLGKREGDIFYRVRFAGQEVLIWFMLEHQSTDVYLMAVRVLEYMTRKWTEHLRTGGPPRRALPMIIPIVVTHAEAGWRSPRSFRELYEGPPAVKALLDRVLLDFTFIVDDLRARTEEEIAATSTSDVLTAVLWSLKSRGRVPESQGPAWEALMQRLARAGHRDAADAVMRYHWERAENEAPVVVRAAMRVDPGLEEMGMGYLDKLRQEAEEKGIERGIEQGIEQGRRSGAAEVLLKQIGLRFGPPSAAIVERVRNAPAPVLERAAERILGAETVDALFD